MSFENTQPQYVPTRQAFVALVKMSVDANSLTTFNEEHYKADLAARIEEAAEAFELDTEGEALGTLYDWVEEDLGISGDWSNPPCANMKTMKIAELIGVALDWAVAKAEGVRLAQGPLTSQLKVNRGLAMRAGAIWAPSTNWAQAGPLIANERIAIEPKGLMWLVRVRTPGTIYESAASSPLVAAMRALVNAKLGEAISVPEELVEWEGLR